ncbi:MAG: hypothetical protein MUE41_05960 [Gemmatimonadaceae bacterium]|nr:hypothetical protein [Gemmatimonadaceae bacterium]
MPIPPRAPYALDLPPFPLPALVAHAGRAPIGNGREVALATLVVARLALGLLDGSAVPTVLREQRAASARVWLASLALPSTTRVPIARAIEASVTGPTAVAGALRSVLAATSGWLDPAAIDELTALIQRLLNGGD